MKVAADATAPLILGGNQYSMHFSNVVDSTSGELTDAMLVGYGFPSSESSDQNSYNGGFFSIVPESDIYFQLCMSKTNPTR